MPSREEIEESARQILKKLKGDLQPSELVALQQQSEALMRLAKLDASHHRDSQGDGEHDHSALTDLSARLDALRKKGRPN